MTIRQFNGSRSSNELPMAGLEPARAYAAQRILSPLRLPFRHIGATLRIVSLLSGTQEYNQTFAKAARFYQYRRARVFDDQTGLDDAVLAGPLD
jgi:hypothetical protein